MTLSLVQHKAAIATAASVSVTLDDDPTPGNLLIAVWKENDGTSTITLPTGFVHVSNSPYAPAGGRQFAIAWKVSDGSETGPLVFGSTNAAAEKQVVVVEVPSLDNEEMYGVPTTTVNTLTAKTLITTGTLPQASCFVISMADQSSNNGGEVGVDSGFTLLDTATLTLMMVGYKITTVDTPLAPTFTWTTARASAGFQAVFVESISLYGNPVAAVFDGTEWVEHAAYVL